MYCKICLNPKLPDSKYCQQHYEEMMAKWDFEKLTREAHDEYYGVDKPKYKLGDEVRIIDNSNAHEFEMGEVVKLGDFDPSDQSWEAWHLDGSDYWYVKEKDVKPLDSVKQDNVNNPSHYGQGKIEAIEYISDFLTPEEYQGYLRGNIAKYLHRFPYKNGVEDLRKASWYLDRLIKEVESND